MNYAYKIEAQRQRFYGSARSIMRKALKSYTAALMVEVNKATTTQEIILASEKELKPDAIRKAMLMIYGKTIPYFANQAVKQLKPKKATPDNIEVDYWHAYIKSKVVPKLANRIKLMTETTEKVFKDTCRRLCADGLAEGLGVDKIARNIQSELGIAEKYRAERIARTEVVSASNEGSLAGAKSTDLDLDKEWISYIDDKTRESHIELNGATVPMKDNFSNGLEYPGDPTGEAEEVINCRCTIGYVVKDDEISIGRTIPE